MPPPIGKTGQFMYILKGALTLKQGQIPMDAFDGEENMNE